MGPTPTIASCLIDNIEMVQWRAARWVKQDYRLTTSTNYYLKFLSLHYWNSLPNKLIESTTLDDFLYYLKSL